MIARLIISFEPKLRVAEIDKILSGFNLTKKHLDVLYFESGEKLGITEARKIKDHFSIKPYSAKGRAVVLEDASILTLDAQNALLKTLEEPPEEAILLLGAPSEDTFLPTILSRCQVVYVATPDVAVQTTPDVVGNIKSLLNSATEERFQYIEKLKNKEEFLQALVAYFRSELHASRPGLDAYNYKMVSFLKELLQAEKWAKQNVNIRAILEYLMLVMPKSGDA